MGYRCRSALEFLTDASKLADKLTGFADSLVSLADLVHSGLQFRRDIGTAVFSEVTVCIRVVFEVGVEFDIVKFHCIFLQVKFSLGWFWFHDRFQVNIYFSAPGAPPTFR